MSVRLLEHGRRLASALRARRTSWLIVGALGFGGLAVVGARNYITDRLEQERARLQPRPEMVELVVARRDLKRGETVGPDTMAVRTLPREYAPGGTVAPARFDAVSGMRLQAPMRAGEPLLAAAVAAPEAAPISSRVRPGVRAMTIAVDEVNSLSGMLQPGDRIDLMLSVRPAPNGGPMQPEVTRTVMQRVPVLATGRQSRPGYADEAGLGRAFTSITVEVDPEQAQRLVVAQRSGKLTAVLRNPDDRQPVGDRRLDVNALLGLPAPMLAAAPAPPPAPVEVIVGGRGGVVPAPPAGPGTAPPAGASPVSPAPSTPPAPSMSTPRQDEVPRASPSEPTSPNTPAVVPLYR
jgi:pilus assembly protein CpaB